MPVTSPFASWKKMAISTVLTSNSPMFRKIPYTRGTPTPGRKLRSMISIGIPSFSGAIENPGCALSLVGSGVAVGGTSVAVGRTISSGVVGVALDTATPPDGPASVATGSGLAEPPSEHASAAALNSAGNNPTRFTSPPPSLGSVHLPSFVGPLQRPPKPRNLRSAGACLIILIHSAKHGRLNGFAPPSSPYMDLLV